jgi:hypothetical protein
MFTGSTKTVKPNIQKITTSKGLFGYKVLLEFQKLLFFHKILPFSLFTVGMFGVIYVFFKTWYF